MQMRSEKGFTLTELIVTMVIVAALAAVGIPLFFNVQTFQDRGFFDSSVSMVRYAQKHAVATGCPVRVQTAPTSIALFRTANATNCSTLPVVTPLADPTGSAPTFTRTPPSGVTLNTVDVTFTALGEATADVVFNVSNRSFQVIAATGFVRRCVAFGCP